jgi:hypothetical protein
MTAVTIESKVFGCFAQENKRVFEKSHAATIRFSIRRIDARSIIVSEVCTRYSKSLLSRRFLPSQAKLRSTIQVRPVILNARCRLFTIRSCHPWCCFRVRANLRLSWPASAITVRILGNNALNPPSSRAPARRSDVSAGSTRLATSRPSVSTKMWRLRPFTRLCASKPRAPPRSVVLTDWPSMITTDGQAARPA